MKKAFVLLLALAILGGAVFAEDLAYTLTGSASLVWGYDLNTENHGFTNTASASLTVPFVAKQNSTHGEEAVTGSLTITGFSANAKDGVLTASGGAVSAKILFPSALYLQIASAPTFAFNNAASFAPWVADEFDDDNGVAAAEIDSVGGFTLGMDGDLSFALKVGSTNAHSDADTETETTWTAVTSGVDVIADGETEFYFSAGEYVAYEEDFVIPANTTYYTSVEVDVAAEQANQYVLGADASYALGDLATIGVNFVYGPMGATAPTMAFGASVNATPIEGLALALGFDFVDEATSAMDLSFTADYTLADLLSFGAGVYFGKADVALDATRLDAKARLGLLAVENLTFEAGVDLWDLMADPANDPMLVLIGAKASYMAMLSETTSVKPYAEFGYELNDEVMALKVGVVAALIPMTTFTVDFTAGELATDDVTGGTNAFDGDKGVFTFTTKITY